MKTQPESEFAKFDNVMRKILSVLHDELEKRERDWKRKRARKKRAKTSPVQRRSCCALHGIAAV
jgi:hypothetical protein